MRDLQPKQLRTTWPCSNLPDTWVNQHLFQVSQLNSSTITTGRQRSKAMLSNIQKRLWNFRSFLLIILTPLLLLPIPLVIRTKVSFFITVCITSVINIKKSWNPKRIYQVDKNNIRIVILLLSDSLTPKLMVLKSFLLDYFFLKLTVENKKKLKGLELWILFRSLYVWKKIYLFICNWFFFLFTH